MARRQYLTTLHDYVRDELTDGWGGNTDDEVYTFMGSMVTTFVAMTWPHFVEWLIDSNRLKKIKDVNNTNSPAAQNSEHLLAWLSDATAWLQTRQFSNGQPSDEQWISETLIRDWLQPLVQDGVLTQEDRAELLQTGDVTVTHWINAGLKEKDLASSMQDIADARVIYEKAAAQGGAQERP